MDSGQIPNFDGIPSFDKQEHHRVSRTDSEKENRINSGRYKKSTKKDKGKMPRPQAVTQVAGHKSSKKAKKQQTESMSLNVQVERGKAAPKTRDYESARLAVTVERSPQLLTPLKGKFSRRLYSSEDNFTPARTVSKELEDLISTTSLNSFGPQKDLLVDAIHDDGVRRIQILYFQFLAYWDEGCTIFRDTTMDQHGFSELEGFSGAHSAVLPRLIDNHIEVLEQQIGNESITSDIAFKLMVLGFSPQMIEELKRAKKGDRLRIFNDHKAQLPADDLKTLLSENTHLYHVANSTIELPHYVNQFHTLFESLLRDDAIRLVNEVSTSFKTPHEAITEFTEKLQKFFLTSEKETDRKISVLRSLSEVDQELSTLVKQCSLEQPISKPALDKLSQQLSKLRTKAEELDGIKRYSLPVNTSALKENLKLAQLMQQAIVKQSQPIKTGKKNSDYYERQEEREKAADELGILIRTPLNSMKFDEEIENLINCKELIHLLIKASDCPLNQKDFFTGSQSRELGVGRNKTISTAELLKHKWELIARRYDFKSEQEAV